MLGTKHSFSALNVETCAPHIGTPELTELRRSISIRQFPKDDDERKCYLYLLEEMRSAPRKPPATKEHFDEDCRDKFRIKAASFDYCWREAIKVTGAVWDQPGRRRRG
jgi:hypothetical protein